MIPSFQSPHKHVFVWDKKFCVRRAHAYAPEDKRLEVGAHQTIMAAFLEARMPILHPVHYSYTALQRFLEKAQMSDFAANSTSASQGKGQVLLDDRRDATGGPHSTRDWDSYSRWPPEGDKIWTKVLDARELYFGLLERYYLPR